MSGFGGLDGTSSQIDQAEHGTRMIDWSQTGRGSHVDFQDNETVPLKQGRFLGRGAVGDVHEVEVQGRILAHKRIVVRRKLGGLERKEIEILKNLPSHEHIVQLVGTYTHRRFLGILLYPVAVCDLHTFFEDVEAWHDAGSKSYGQDDRLKMLEASQESRLVELGYDFPETQKPYNATLVYSKIGCLVSAISYLHERKIRHKDIKPSNILLSHNRLWLSDFGNATDFSLLSQSATDNERGSPRYFSPEVNAWEPNGRAADIFSLGCVLLEILVIHTKGTLQYMQANRSQHPAFHANLDRVDSWLQDPHSLDRHSRRAHLEQEIKSMLANNPEMRPTASQLLLNLTRYDLSKTSNFSIFGQCCKSTIISKRVYREELADYKSSIGSLESALQQAHSTIETMQSTSDRLVQEKADVDHRLFDEQNRSAGLENVIAELASMVSRPKRDKKEPKRDKEREGLSKYRTEEFDDPSNGGGAEETPHDGISDAAQSGSSRPSPSSYPAPTPPPPPSPYSYPRPRPPLYTYSYPPIVDLGSMRSTATSISRKKTNPAPFFRWAAGLKKNKDG